MRFDGFPFVVGWELTLACNLRCRHCGSTAGDSRVCELTLEESLAVCDQFPSLLVQEVDFTGGEPLLRPDWQKIAARLGSLGIKTKMISNGIALTAETVTQIKDNGIAGVGVSLDGLEESHDYLRNRKGLFQLVLAGIGRVINAGLPVTVITTVNALNVGELPVLATLLTSIGVRSWQIQPIFPLGRSRDSDEFLFGENAYLSLGAFYRDWGPRARAAGLEIGPGDSFGYYTELDAREPPWRGCPAGLLSCGITSDGKIKGCLSLPDELIEGDLRKQDLWDIWFHPNSFLYTREFAEEDLGTACRSCKNAEQCHGGCSAMSYGSTGRFHSDPFCFHGIRTRADIGIQDHSPGTVQSGRGTTLSASCVGINGGLESRSTNPPSAKRSSCLPGEGK